MSFRFNTHPFVSPPPARPVLRAPWDTHDQVEPLPFAAWFVGETLWAQTHGCVWRFGPDRQPRLLRVTGQLRLTRALGQWVEFRSERGWDRNHSMIESPIRGIHLYDTHADSWHVGPWPDGLDLWIRQAIEPEDFILHEPLRGWSLDVARWDRHGEMVFAAGGGHALIDDQIVDLQTGEVRRVSMAPDASVEELLTEPVPVLGPPGILSERYRSVHALCVSAEGSWRAFLAGVEQNPFGVVVRKKRLCATLSTAVQAVAFDAVGQHLALVTERSVQVYALDRLSAPLWEFELPWPWCDPFVAVERGDPRSEHRRHYREQFGPWLEADAELRRRLRLLEPAESSPTSGVHGEAPLGSVEDPSSEDDIAF